jgi:hypothetical protein
VEEDETVASVEQSEKEPLTVAEIVKTSGYETLCRKDSGIGGANVLNQQTMPTTPTDDYSLPDCDLVFQNANWMPGDMTRSSAPNSLKVTLVSKENLPSSGWMAQIDASDEIKQKREEVNKTRLSSAFKTTFLRIPSQYERYGLSNSFLSKSKAQHFFFKFPRCVKAFHDERRYSICNVHMHNQT